MINERVFDTLVDTKKLFVAIKANFRLRDYKNSDGLTPVILNVTGNRQRERISIDMNIDTKDWNCVKQRLNPTSDYNRDLNLILDNIISKITALKTTYRLAEKTLTPNILRKELIDGMPRVKFTAFFKQKLEEEKYMLAEGTYNRLLSTLKKINEYDTEISFMDLDLEWIKRYRRHLAGIGNKKTTIASNIATIKKYLLLATKEGIKLKFNVSDIKAGKTNGNRTSLKPEELKRLADYYFSGLINESYKLILGYFLFSCMTGLRISDVQKLTRNDLLDGYIDFVAKKTVKDQSISLNETAKKILAHDPRLFEIKFADQHINDELKKIMKFIGIEKHVTFHVARHTFATSFLRAGGKVEKLQKLLRHSNISDTMVYVHIVEAEANSEIFLLDNLFI